MNTAIVDISRTEGAVKNGPYMEVLVKICIRSDENPGWSYRYLRKNGLVIEKVVRVSFGTNCKNYTLIGNCYFLPIEGEKINCETAGQMSYTLQELQRDIPQDLREQIPYLCRKLRVCSLSYLDQTLSPREAGDLVHNTITIFSNSVW